MLTDSRQAGLRGAGDTDRNRQREYQMKVKTDGDRKGWEVQDRGRIKEGSLKLIRN